jgi:uncharacterized protein DUF6064
VRLPFTTDQFLAVFARYNDAITPAQLLLLLLGLGAVLLALRPTRWSDRTIGAVLAALWAWMGIMYHWRFFRTINPIAAVFGALFVLEACLLLWYAVVRPQFVFVAGRSLRGALGLILLVYAFAVYPAVGYLLGQRYPAFPTFGLPCPTTIATLALLLWTETAPPLAVLVIPWVWGVVGGVAAVQLGVSEDFGLPIATGISIWAWWRAQRSDRARLSLTAT